MKISYAFRENFHSLSLSLSLYLLSFANNIEEFPNKKKKKHSGIRRAGEESLRRPREERDRAARLATRLEVSRGEGSRMREEDTPIGAGGVGREGIEGAGPYQFSGFSDFPKLL